MEQFDYFRGLVLPTLNFVIFMALLIYFGRKPLAEFAAKRKTDFEAKAQEATRARAEAEKKYNELSARYAVLEVELQKIRAMTLEAAKGEADKITADAARLAQHIRDEAKRTAETEIENAKKIVRAEIVGAARAEVERRLQTELGAGGQKNILAAQIEKLSTMKSAGA